MGDSKSGLEQAMANQIAWAGLPKPEREYRFHPKRRFRLDFAWPERRLGLEVQGGTWSGGAHGRGSGIARDYEKLNLALLQGWRVLQVDTKMVKDGRAIGLLIEALAEGEEIECTAE
jgi:very-short-patch-repair endonuclease